MPFVRRNAEGRIVALLGTAEADATESLPEALPYNDPELLLFLGMPPPTDSFSTLDQEFIRVMEDLIDVLIEKGVLRLTDLPPQAQHKLLTRKDRRRKLKGALNLLGGDDVI